MGYRPAWLGTRINVEPETLAALLFFVASTYSMTMLQIAGDARHIRHYGTNNSIADTALPDIGHQLLPHFDDEALLDFSVNSMAILAIVRVLFTDRPQRALRRLLWIQATIHALRGLVLFVTTLPNPYTNECLDSSNQNVFYLALRVSFRLSITCSDITISGHSCTTTSAILFQLLYTRMGWLAQLAALVYLSAVWCFIVASRYHYTVDVVLGAILTFSVYSMYHLALLVPSLSGRYGFVERLVRLVWATDGVLRRRKELPPASYLPV